MRPEAHQFVRLNLVPAHWAGLREVELGFSLKPRCHQPPPAHLPCAPAFGSSGGRGGPGTPLMAGSVYAHHKADTWLRWAGLAQTPPAPGCFLDSPCTGPHRASSFLVPGTWRPG